MCPAMLGINLADNPSAMRQVQRIRQDSCKYANTTKESEDNHGSPSSAKVVISNGERMNQIVPHACMRRKKNQSDENRNAGQFHRLGALPLASYSLQWWR